MTYEEIIENCLQYHVRDIALNGTTKYANGCVVVNGSKEKWCINCGQGCNKETCTETQKISSTHFWLERKEKGRDDGENYWECIKCGAVVYYVEYPPPQSMTCDEAIMRRALL